MRAAATMAALAIALAAPAAAQCHYDVQVIKPDDCGVYGGPPPLYGYGLNNRGWVVGWHYPCFGFNDVPFLWTPEDGYQVLPLPPGATEMRCEDVNDDGVIVGTAVIAGLGDRGVVYRDGEFTILPPVDDVGWSWCSGINNDGVVVGMRSIGGTGINPYNAFIWTEADGFTDLGVMEGPFSSATDVSENGVVVGWTGSQSVYVGFVWEDGETTVLDQFPGGGNTTVNGVSSNGRIRVGLGESEKENVLLRHALAIADGQVSELTLSPGFDSANATHAHDAGQIYGEIWNAGMSERHAVIWRLDGEPIDLAQFVTADLGELRGGLRTNDAGQILVLGHDLLLDRVAFLLTPVDRPPGDITIDCAVDVAVLLFLLSEWGPGESVADLNGDGRVDAADLLVVLTDWS
jgi:probable HAF family extracellular repeat protein